MVWNLLVNQAGLQHMEIRLPLHHMLELMLELKVGATTPTLDKFLKTSLALCILTFYFDPFLTLPYHVHYHLPYC